MIGPSWARIDAFARALLDEPTVRERVALRIAPSLLRAPGGVRWIGPGDPFGEWREAELDDRLAAILEAAVEWTAWPRVREAARIGGEDEDGDGDGIDELLLTMVDGGLLQTELAPPLIGGPAAEHVMGRLRGLGLEAQCGGLEAAVLAFEAGDWRAGAAALDALPGYASALTELG